MSGTEVNSQRTYEQKKKKMKNKILSIIDCKGAHNTSGRTTFMYWVVLMMF